MLIYIILPIFLLLLINVKDKRKIYIVLFLLFAINICRDYSVGWDYGVNYKRMYDEKSLYTQSLESLGNINTSNIISTEAGSMEIGWTLIEYFCNKNNLPFAIVNLVAAIIIFIALSRSLKQSPLPILSLLLYVLLFRYYASFNIIRQSIAALIFLISIPYIINRQFYKYLIFCLIATCFHISALLMIPFYYIPKIKIKFYGTILVFIVLYIISMLKIDTTLFSTLYDYGVLIDRYAKYLIIENEYTHNLAFLYIPSLLLLIPYIVLNYKSRNDKLDTYQLLYFIAIIISIISINLEVLFRFNEYFLNALIIGIPILLAKQTISLVNIRSYIVIGCCTLYYSAYLYINANAIIPYTLIF